MSKYKFEIKKPEVGDWELPVVTIFNTEFYNVEVEELRIRVSYQKETPSSQRPLWAVWPYYKAKSGDEFDYEEPFAFSEKATGITAVFARLARKYGANLKQDELDELGQWAIWANAGNPNDRNSREYKSWAT